MYVIVGGDGKEYGPVSGADLRQWISEDRLNARSLVKAESDAEFRPLSTFPEFADLFEIAGRVSNAPPPLGSASQQQPRKGIATDQSSRRGINGGLHSEHHSRAVGPG